MENKWFSCREYPNSCRVAKIFLGLEKKPIPDKIPDLDDVATPITLKLTKPVLKILPELVRAYDYLAKGEREKAMNILETSSKDFLKAYDNFRKQYEEERNSPAILMVNLAEEEFSDILGYMVAGASNVGIDERELKEEFATGEAFDRLAGDFVGGVLTVYETAKSMKDKLRDIV